MSDLNYMSGIHNRLYFVQEHNYPPHGGIRGIAYRADNWIKIEDGQGSFLTNVVDTTKLASTEDADLLFDIMDNLVDRSTSEQDRFLSALKKVMQMYSTSPNCCVLIPSDRKTGDRMCLRSQRSIFNGLPCEPTFERDSHAMISLDDTLDVLFAKGIGFNFIQDHCGERNTEGWNGA